MPPPIPPPPSHPVCRERLHKDHQAPGGPHFTQQRHLAQHKQGGAGGGRGGCGEAWPGRAPPHTTTHAGTLRIPVQQLQAAVQDLGEEGWGWGRERVQVRNPGRGGGGRVQYIHGEGYG